MQSTFGAVIVVAGVLAWTSACAPSRDAASETSEAAGADAATDMRGDPSEQVDAGRASDGASAGADASPSADAGTTDAAGDVGAAGSAGAAGNAQTTAGPPPPAAGSSGGAAGSGAMANMTPSMGAAGSPAPDKTSLSFVTEPMDEAVYVFDPSQVRTYDIRVAAADLARIDAHPAAEEWIPAELVFEGKTYGPLKMRYKGSTGSFTEPCTAGDPDDPKAGKCSLKLGFDEVDENLRFYGLKKLNFHAMNHDFSMLRDRLGYSLFRESDVVAPRAVHARVSINGKLEGLFIAVEQIDGRFTRARFAEGGEGNVYKATWVSSTGEQQFVDSLETNSEVHDVSGILDFQTAVNTSADAAEQFLDRAYMMRYLAVDRVIVNDDGAMHFYCDPNGAPSYYVGNGNYYWYQSEQSRHFWLIPWDLDLAFDGTPWVTVVPAWYVQAECTCIAPPTMYAAQMPPSCDPLVQHFVTWRADYEREVDAFLAGPFAAVRVEQKLQAWEDQIRPFVIEAAGTNGAPSRELWESGVRDLRAKIEAQREHRGYAYE